MTPYSAHSASAENVPAGRSDSDASVENLPDISQGALSRKRVSAEESNGPQDCTNKQRRILCPSGSSSGGMLSTEDTEGQPIEIDLTGPDSPSVIAHNSKQTSQLRHYRERLANLEQKMEEMTQERDALFRDVIFLQSENLISRERWQRDVLDVLENEQTCVICNDVFIQPAVVECGHVFCSYCVANWMAQAQPPIKPTCPTCRLPVETPVRIHGFEGYLTRLYSLFSEEVQRSREQLLDERGQQQETWEAEMVVRRAEREEVARRRREQQTRTQALIFNEAERARRIVYTNLMARYMAPTTGGNNTGNGSATDAPANGGGQNENIANAHARNIPQVARLMAHYIVHRNLRRIRPNPNDNMAQLQARNNDAVVSGGRNPPTAHAGSVPPPPSSNLRLAASGSATSNATSLPRSNILDTVGTHAGSSIGARNGNLVVSQAAHVSANSHDNHHPAGSSTASSSEVVNRVDPPPAHSSSHYLRGWATVGGHEVNNPDLTTRVLLRSASSQLLAHSLTRQASRLTNDVIENAQNVRDSEANLLDEQGPANRIDPENYPSTSASSHMHVRNRANINDSEGRSTVSNMGEISASAIPSTSQSTTSGFGERFRSAALDNQYLNLTDENRLRLARRNVARRGQPFRPGQRVRVEATERETRARRRSRDRRDHHRSRGLSRSETQFLGRFLEYLNQPPLEDLERGMRESEISSDSDSYQDSENRRETLE